MKALVSYLSSADSRAFSVHCITLCLLFAFIHFNHKFHEQFYARPYHWASVDSVSSPWGALAQLSPKQSSQSQIEIWNTINQWSFCQFSECQASLHKR